MVGAGIGGVTGIGAVEGVAGGLGSDGTRGPPGSVGPFELGRGVSGFFVNHQDATQDEAEGVSDDGSTAGRDAALGHKDDEVSEGRVDFLGGFEGGNDFTEKIGGEVGAIRGRMSCSSGTIDMTRAKSLDRILRPETALGTRAIAGAATI